MSQGWLGAWLTACIWFVTTVAAAGVRDAAASPSNDVCAYTIAYSAPSGCPTIAAMEQHLGTEYNFHQGTLATCPDCVLGVVLEAEPDRGGYRLRIAGLESGSVTRRDCNELAELAIYAIEASDLPPPVCLKTSAFVGVSAAPLLNVDNGDPLLSTQLRLTLPLGPFEFTPYGLWQPEATVQNQVARDGRPLNPEWERLSLEGYGAGLEVCWPVLNGLFGHHDVLHLCGAGLWRRFSATPPAGDASIEAELWTLGGSVSWRIPVFETLHVEVAPTVLMGLGDAATYEAGTGARLYQYAGLEAQLRIGISWEFIVSRTLSRKEPSRASPAAVLAWPRTATGFAQNHW